MAGEGQQLLCFLYRMSVLTLAHSMSYMPLTAVLIWRLLARVSTMKTRVLWSSIFFMADSVWVVAINEGLQVSTHIHCKCSQAGSRKHESYLW